MNLIEHINESYNKANNGISKIDISILQIEGMSGEATRHFYNNICSMDNAKYLEIGSWKGSTLCAAMYNNNATIVSIDNWSQYCGGEYGNVKNEFLSNFNKYIGKNNAIFYEEDCFKLDINKLPTFNIYMYDGDHKYEDHYNALPYYISRMEDEFIFIIDDWNQPYIREATIQSINDLKLNILFQKDIFTNINEPALPRIYNGGCDRRPWANGCGVFVLQKK